MQPLRYTGLPENSRFRPMTTSVPRRFITLSVALLLGTVGTFSNAQTPSPVASSEPGSEKPLWELGFGAGALHGPDYPASSETHLRGLALPYMVYRGEVFRMGDGQTARAVAYESQRLELDLSFDAAFDAKSDNNEMRQDMPDLDFMFQLGPQLTVNLHDRERADGSRSRIFLALQARAVFSSDLSRVDHRGYVFEPMLRYRHYDWLVPGLDTTISLRPLWASEKLHAYFYDVAPQFASPGRPAYDSRGGYFGTGLNFYASYQLTEQASVFLGLQTTSHHGAENRGSPLHQKDFTVGYGAGFIWKLIASRKMVTVP